MVLTLSQRWVAQRQGHAEAVANKIFCRLEDSEMNLAAAMYMSLEAGSC